MHYFRHVHKVHDPTYFFPWLYKSVPKLPKASVKSKSKQRAQDRHNKICRRKIFIKHLGLSEDVPDNSQVAYPVHFPLALYVAEPITWLSMLYYYFHYLYIFYCLWLLQNSARIKWDLKDIRRMPESIPFARVEQVGGTREDFEFVPNDKSKVFLAPTVGIKHGISNIAVRYVVTHECVHMLVFIHTDQNTVSASWA